MRGDDRNTLSNKVYKEERMELSGIGTVWNLLDLKADFSNLH